MILIVDSGSTKTDWIALGHDGEELFSTQTLGLNPQMLSNEILNERIKNNYDIYKNRKSVNKLFFYGAGCGVESSQNRILNVFESIFINQILKQARKNKIENGLFDSEAISTFNTMIDEKYSDILSKKTNFGISDALFNQFKSQVINERKK